MNIYRIPALPALLTVGCLSACGDLQDALEFQDDFDEFRDRRDSLLARSNTAYLAVPDTGSRTYTGEASLGAGTEDAGIVLVGDASITIDFGNQTVAGQLENFGGFDNEENYSDYSGALILQSGILGSTNPNDVDGQLTGTLRGEIYVVDVDALWEGHLKGTPIRGVLGDTTTTESTFTLNGETVAGGIVVAVSE